MKVFAATKEGQGSRESDFSFVEENDLVTFSSECERDKYDVDGGCGCRRSMSSFNTGTGTTTFKVVDIEMSKEDYVKLVTIDERKKWGETEDEDDSAPYEVEAEELLQAASVFPVGIVLEKRGNDIQPRPQFSWTRERDEE